MPFDRFALILAGVLAAAGLTIGAAALLGVTEGAGAVPLVLVAALLLRVVLRRPGRGGRA